MFTAVSSSRVSDLIVEQIRTLIRTRRLRPGDRLPSERELGELVNASRVTVREALRVLQAAGLVTIRAGAGGGAVVARPGSDQLGAGLASLLTLEPVSAAQVTETRLVLETQILPLVVDRATPGDLAALREMAEAQIAAIRAGAYHVSRSAQFHIRVAACAHNAAIDMMANSLYGPVVMSLQQAKGGAPLIGEQGAFEHLGLVDAIAAHDVDAARTLMRAHIGRTARRLAAGTG